MDWYVEKIRKESNENCETLSKAGIEFERTQFAEYITIGDTIATAESIVAVIDDAKQAVVNSNYDNLQDALESLTDENKPEVEICGNAEWLEVYGGYEGEEEDEHNDKVNWKRFDNDIEEMRNAFSEADFVSAKGQRILCHQWNGAHFTHRGNGCGTFCVLTEEGEKLWGSI